MIQGFTQAAQQAKAFLQKVIRYEQADADYQRELYEAKQTKYQTAHVLLFSDQLKSLRSSLNLFYE